MYRCILIVGAIFLVYAHAHNLLEGASCEDRGVQGTCRQAQLCPSYGLLANSQDHSKVTLCSPDGAPVVVCCTDCYVDDVSKAEVTLNGIVWKTGGDRKSYDKCVEFAARLPYPCKDGKKAAPKKVYDAEKKCHRLDVDVEDVAAAKKERVDFPSLVLLGYVHNATQPPRWQCQGFIISERFVLSTAHCSRDLNAGPPWVLAAGVARRPSEDGAPAAASWQLYRVKRYITHPEWNGRSKYNDIGLMETETDIKFGVDVLPMCLSELASPAAVEADVLGVGTEDNQKVKIEKLDEAECSKQFPSYRSLQDGINFATQACYKGFNESVYSCRGSSGRPLYVPGELRCVNSAVAFVSFGHTCASVTSATVYTRIHTYLPWIESVAWP